MEKEKREEKGRDGKEEGGGKREREGRKGGRKKGEREGCVTVACSIAFTWRAYLVEVVAAVVKLIAGCVTIACRGLPWAVGRAPLTAGGVVGSNA